MSTKLTTLFLLLAVPLAAQVPEWTPEQVEDTLWFLRILCGSALVALVVHAARSGWRDGLDR